MSDAKEEHREFKTDEDFDKDFFKDIERKTNIWQCIQCGTCTASCESGRWTALKTRIIIRKVCLGDLTVLKDPDIWLCTTCYNCYERCPRDVRPTDVIMQLRNYATKLGNISPNHRAVVGYLTNFGHAVPINDEIRKQRVELGLEELPPTAFKYKQEGDDKDLKKFEEHLFDLPPIKEDTKKEEEK
ncbi:MAG: CoB--CoM heterodisulfide reductase subunit C [Candidatus Heimdallarchaeota archaeon]